MIAVTRHAAVVLGWIAATSVASRTGYAETLDDCPAGPSAVHLTGPPFAGVVREAFVVQLRTALRVRGIDVCARQSDGPPESIASIEIAHAGDARFVIVVKDALLAKRVERTVDLGSLPPDGRPLALALATDELLRASWAELLLADARPEKPAPPEVHRAISPERSDVEPTPRRVEIGAGASGEIYTNAPDHLGGDVFATFWALPRLGLEARIGGRAVAAAEAPRGEVRSSAVVGAIGPTVRLVTIRDRVGLDLGTQVAVVRVRLEGEARPPTIGRQESATAIYTNGKLRGWLALSPGFRLVSEVGVGMPLHTVRALDGNLAVGGVGGTQVSGMLGATGVF
jgi:hypothetical protein